MKIRIAHLLLCLVMLFQGCASVFDAPQRGTRVDRTGAYSITHWNSEGKPVQVSIAPRGCSKADGLAYTHMISDAQAVINLCGLEGLLDHELAHVAGMRHTDWRDGCAKVTAPGTKTKYRIGQIICHSNGMEKWRGE